MSAPWSHLLNLAREEVEQTCRHLPAPLRAHAEAVPVTYESTPGDALIAGGWDPDLLGMFVGDPVGVADAESFPVPRQILLFLENLWDFAAGEEQIYREEVRVTYLHELGHYLGLDESELDGRGLL